MPKGGSGSVGDENGADRAIFSLAFRGEREYGRSPSATVAQVQAGRPDTRPTGMRKQGPETAPGARREFRAAVVKLCAGCRNRFSGSERRADFGSAKDRHTFLEGRLGSTSRFPTTRTEPAKKCFYYMARDTHRS